MQQYRIGVDLGGTNIKAGVVNATHEIIGKASLPTNTGRPFTEIVADIARAIKLAVADAGVTLEECASIGLGSPGTVEASTGRILFAGNFDWVKVPLAGTLAEHFPDLPVRLSNDANCAALGEVVAGAAKGYQNAIMITLGTGVGGGVVLDGKLFEGAPGATELGHSLLVLDGEPCTCGRKGCWEAYASATAIVREGLRRAKAHPESIMNEMMAQNGGEMNGRIPFDAARAGDAAGQSVVDDYIHWLAAGLVDMANIFRPEIILLSGGVCNEGEYLTDPVNEYVQRYAFASHYTMVPKVTRAKLGNDAGIIGAAAL